MVRVLFYLILTLALGAFFAYVANYNGAVEITFGQYVIETSLLASVALLFLSILAVYVFYKAIKFLFISPFMVKEYFHRRQQQQDERQMQQALLAILSGDHVSARILCQRLSFSSLPVDDKSAMLLAFLKAENHKLERNYPALIADYEQMRDNPTTRLQGLFGLYQEAIRAKAYEAAHQYARQAYEIKPQLSWAQRNLLERAIYEKDWAKAINLFSQIEKYLPYKEQVSQSMNHQRAILHSAIAEDIYLRDPQEAKRLVLKAYKLDPDYVPVVSIGAKILYHLHEERKASKWIENLWKKQPHPDLAHIYVQAEGQYNANERLERARKLEFLRPDHVETYACVATAAFDAKEWLMAEKYTQKALACEERQKFYLLLADIEEMRRGDKGLIKQWLYRAQSAPIGPCWMADNMILERWSVLSPISGRFDAVYYGIPPRILSTIEAISEDEKIEATAPSQASKISEAEEEQLQQAAKEEPRLPNIAIDHPVLNEEDPLDEKNKHLKRVLEEHFTVDDPGVIKAKI